MTVGWSGGENLGLVVRSKSLEVDEICGELSGFGASFPLANPPLEAGQGDHDRRGDLLRGPW